ncbi:MAG: hypothetical protein KDB10_15345, partial [Acidimicrobiales bacterium]|nr:hypothetical protein [Acidimicrobiales bacterium]
MSATDTTIPSDIETATATATAASNALAASGAARAQHPSGGRAGVLADRDLLSVLAADARRRAAVVEVVVPVVSVVDELD